MGLHQAVTASNDIVPVGFATDCMRRAKLDPTTEAVVTETDAGIGNRWRPPQASLSAAVLSGFQP